MTTRRKTQRVDICEYPPAAITVAAELQVKREVDALIFHTPQDKLKFDRRVRELAVEQFVNNLGEP